jgi:hypothetical protein
LDNLRKGNPNAPKLPTARQGARPITSKVSRPGTGRSIRGAQGADGEDGDYIPPPPKKSNTPVIVGACIGGAVLLLVVIIAASGGKSTAPVRARATYDDSPSIVVPEYTPEKPKEVLKFDGQRFHDTGAIMFICANSGTHADREVEVNTCPKCKKYNQWIYWQSKDKYVCWNCETEYPKSEIKCTDCGRPPQKACRIKHK